MGCWCDTISPNLKIAVNIKNLPVNPGYRFNKIFFSRSSHQKIPCFIRCVLAFCVVIFLIQCDFSDCSYTLPCFQPERESQNKHIESGQPTNGVFIRHQGLRSGNLQFTRKNSLANVQQAKTIFYLDVEPLSKYSPVTLYLSLATRIINEKPDQTKLEFPS